MILAPGVYSLAQPGGKGGHVHAFLLEDGSELTLIDTLYDTDGEYVLQTIRRIGRQATDLKHIVLTHGHRSHLGGLAALKRASGATIYAHEWEADIIAGERLAQGVTLVPMQPLSAYWRVYHLQLGLALGLGAHPPCPVDQAVTEGDQVGPVEVLHMPGHSPGHLAFYWPKRCALFAGDAIATWPQLDAGWPAFNLNAAQAGDSLRRMAALEAAVVGVGHGEPVTRNAAERVRSLLA